MVKDSGWELVILFFYLSSLPQLYLGCWEQPSFVSGARKNELNMISATRFGFQEVNFGLRDHRVVSLKTGVLNKQTLFWTKNG